MLEEIAKNASIVQVGLLGAISILLTVIAFFVKKTYDKADALDLKFNEAHQENLDLQQGFNNHKSQTSEILIKAKLEFTEALDKMKDIAFDIKDDVINCMKAVESNQEQIKANKTANELAKKIHQNHHDRLKKAETSIEVIGKDVYLIRSQKNQKRN